MTFKPCIVIPNYNHTEAIEQTLASLSLPVILVDDCSDPPVADLLSQLAERFAHVTLIRHPVNQGKGGAVMSGLRAALALGYSHALQVDADGQHCLDDVAAFIGAAERHPDALIAGIPEYDESVPKHRFYARYLTHVWVWIETLSLELRDSMCGFRVYPLAATVAILDRARLGRRMDFDIEILVRHYWAGTPVMQKSTRVIYPENGLSHFRAWQDNWLISKMHTRLFFGMLWRWPMLLWRRRGRS